MGDRERGRNRRGRRVLIALLVGVPALPLVPAVPTASAQALPPVLPGPRVALLAAPGDRATYIPPPFGRVPDRASASADVEISFDNGFPDSAKVPVRAALDIWAGIVASPQPITVVADYSDLGSSALATAGPTQVFRDFSGAPLAGTFYAQPLAEALSGQNLGGSRPDVMIHINIRNDWYFGTDGNTPSGQYDLMGTVLHEFLHGLGFIGTMNVIDSQGSWGQDTPRRPYAYERFTETSGGADLVNTSVYPNPSATLGKALQGGSVWFNSPRTNRGLADRVRLFAPNPWQAASSFSHLDEDAYPAGSANALGTPYLNSREAVHSPGPLALCMLEAMGWTTPENCTPPALTAVTGFTWYSTGGYDGAGPNGTVIRAYATGAQPGKAYQLVSGLDGGWDKPCMWDTLPLNPNNRVANSGGVVSTTAGVLDRGPGRWQICFREVGTGNTLGVTAPATFQVA